VSVNNPIRAVFKASPTITVLYYVAASLDGYIAAHEGGVEWLSPFEGTGKDITLHNSMPQWCDLPHSWRAQDKGKGDWKHIEHEVDKDVEST
jgi:hypothetical protein